MDPLPGVSVLQRDFLEPETVEALIAALGPDKADVVISDMAASASGHRQTDHLKIMALCDAALDFAKQVLKPGGTFLCKVLRGGTERELLDGMNREFAMVRHVKPKASRSKIRPSCSCWRANSGDIEHLARLRAGVKDSRRPEAPTDRGWNMAPVPPDTHSFPSI